MKSKKRINSAADMSRRTFLKGSLAGASLLASGLLSSSVLAHDESSGMIEVNDTNLYHDVVGSGIPILVMHGGLGLDQQYFRPTTDSWTDFAQLIYYDHRGNGQSDDPDDYESITMEVLASDGDALRAALNFDKVILYGHSYGGFIALEYATRYQENLFGLILSNTLPRLGYDLNMQEWGTEEAFEAFGKLFGGPMASDEEWAETWRTALPLYWKDIDQQAELAADIHERTNYKAAAWNRASAMLAEYNVTEQLGDITVPTLILSGRQDFITVYQAHEEMHEAMPNSELVFFEDSGHFPFITESEKYTSAIQDWVSNL